MKDLAAKNRVLLAANHLAGRFNPVGQFIRAWNNWDGNEDGLVNHIVDFNNSRKEIIN